MEARYVPVKIELEPRESINSTLHPSFKAPMPDPGDMGILRVDVLRAQGLMAADRGGKSDVSTGRSSHRMITLILAIRDFLSEWHESLQVGYEEEVRFTA